jgi:hypothetical protein
VSATPGLSWFGFQEFSQEASFQIQVGELQEEIARKMESGDISWDQNTY